MLSIVMFWVYTLLHYCQHLGASVNTHFQKLQFQANKGGHKNGDADHMQEVQ